MKQMFEVVTVRGDRINVFSSLDGISDVIKTDIKRGDGLLVNAMEGGKNVGKQLIFVAGFTYEPETYPSIIMWYGDPSYIVKAESFVVFGRYFTEEFTKEAVIIELPKA